MKNYIAVGIQFYNCWTGFSFVKEKPMFQGEMNACVVKMGFFSVFWKWIPKPESNINTLIKAMPQKGHRGYRRFK